MRTKYLTASSWTALCIAIFSWCAAAFFLYTVLQMQSERAQSAEDAAAANLQAGQAAQLRILARETETDRTSLENASNVDVLSAVNVIESVSASGTAVHVTTAQPVRTAAKGSSQQLNTMDLTAHAEGPFASVMHIEQMLETLPLATSIQEIDISRAPVDLGAKNSAETWSLNVRLRFYTTATLST
jgi:hypothetical protein